MNYSALAPIYDRLMSHVNYDLWLTLIRTLCEKEFPAVSPTIFEIGGGSGILGRILKDNGFAYTGSDLSFDMCREAVKKSLPFFCTNALHLALKKKFHLLLFLYDGINYLNSLEKYTALCHQAHSCLCDGGIFLFDITTEKNSLTNFYDFLDTDDLGDTIYLRHSFYNQASKLQHNNFTIFCKDAIHPELFHKKEEHHTQRVFSPKEIASAIPRNLFTIKGVFDNFSYRRYTASSERIHFSLKKKPL